MLRLPVDVQLLPLGNLTTSNKVCGLISVFAPLVPCICRAIDLYPSTLALLVVKFEESAPTNALPTTWVTLSKYVAIDWAATAFWLSNKIDSAT